MTDALTFRDRDALEGAGDVLVFAVLHGSAEAPLDAAVPHDAPHADYPELDACFVRLPARRLIELAGHCAQIEIVDDKMIDRVNLFLNALRQILAQQGVMFAFGVVSISLGVPKALLGLNRSAELLVGKALGRIVATGVPVVMSIGNDGPADGTANPWALTPGVIAVTATDSTGGIWWPSASTLRPGDATGNLFAAHGYLSVGAKGSGSPKTPAMVAAEAQVDLTMLVGAGNEHLYQVDSGTSYAAARLGRIIGLVHQAVMALQLIAGGVRPLEALLPPYVRAYLDSGVDATHPMFDKRLADRTPIYGGMSYAVTRDQRARLHRLVFEEVVLDLRYRREVVTAVLRRAAIPVPGTEAHQTGQGYVSYEQVQDVLAGLTPLDLVQLFANPADPRFERWCATAAADGDPVFRPDDIANFRTYCETADLALMLKVV